MGRGPPDSDDLGFGWLDRHNRRDLLRTSTSH